MLLAHYCLTQTMVVTLRSQTGKGKSSQVGRL